MSELKCPHCGGEIALILTQPVPQNGRKTGAVSPAGTVAEDLGSKTRSAPKRTPYNQGYDPLFLEFWNIYPLKRDKRKALNAWRNAVARAPHNIIVQGARRYREDPNREAGFTKYAERWLNGDCWEDEALPVRPRTGTQQGPEREYRPYDHFDYGPALRGGNDDG